MVNARLLTDPRGAVGPDGHSIGGIMCRFAVSRPWPSAPRSCCLHWKLEDLSFTMANESLRNRRRSVAVLALMTARKLLW